MSQYPEKSRFELFMDAAKPISDWVDASIDASEKTLIRVGSMCNGLYYNWLFSPRNERELFEDTELEKIEFAKRSSDYAVGLRAVALAAASGLLVIGMR